MIRVGCKNLRERFIDLSWGYLISGNEAYVQHAVHLLDVWFLNPETKMNPNLTYAKYTPGMEKPYPTGVIATHNWVDLVQAIGFLMPSEHCEDALVAGLRDWFRAYIDWLQTSHQGVTESQLENNRGIWYDVQIAAFALFSGDTDLARTTIVGPARQRLEQQIAADGSLPKELERTNGLTYSLMTLRAFLTLGLIGERLDMDLFHHTAADGRGLINALDYIQPYAMDPSAWPHQQIKSGLIGNRAAPVYAIAAEIYGDQRYADVVQNADHEQMEVIKMRTLYSGMTVA